MTIALETRSLTKQFGGLTAVNAVDLIIEENAIFSVIGPNGAGKTTFYNCITGFYEPEAGDVLFYGKSLVGLTPDQVTYRGYFPYLSEHPFVRQHECHRKYPGR